jgi:predicted nucleotidyltransferase
MNFIQFLKENKDSRKIFGEKEIEIIEKQANGIKLTQSERNRLSRDIRKKLMFIEKFSRFGEFFELKKGCLVKELIEEAKTEILNGELRKKIKRIYLFGSFIEDKMTFSSDIDIAVEMKQIEKKEAIKFRARLMGKLNNKLDIQVFNFLPEKIKTEILKKHRVLYKNEG